MEVMYSVRSMPGLYNEAPVDKFTDWERFQGLAFEIISPRIQINSENKPRKRPATLLLYSFGVQAID
jgi:hypothetical protein